MEVFRLTNEEMDKEIILVSLATASVTIENTPTPNVRYYNSPLTAFDVEGDGEWVRLIERREIDLAPYEREVIKACAQYQKYTPHAPLPGRILMILIDKLYRALNG